MVNTRNKEVRTDSLRQQTHDNLNNLVQNSSSRKLPSNGSIIEPSTQTILDSNTVQDLLNTLQEKVGSTATQQLPRGIECNPASKVPDESKVNAAWPVKLTGGSNGCDDHTLPQEPAG
jgi:hypothetical protein